MFSKILLFTNIHIIFLFIIILQPLCTETLSKCNQTCGSETVNYPFGFSAGCKFRLNCSTAGELELAGLRVLNITDNAIVLDFPPICNRSSNDINCLFGANYALTGHNALFLRSCKNSNITSCHLWSQTLSPRLNSIGCADKLNDINCFSGGGTADDGWFDRKNCSAAECGDLFTVGRYFEDADHTAVDFGVAEVGWWVEGGCRCAKNANCTMVRMPAERRMGFRCSCVSGFVGDGFADGQGCSKDSKCGASSHLIGKCRGTRGIAILVGGIIAATCLLFFSMFTFCCIKRRSSILRYQSTQQLFYQSSCAVPVYTFKEIECATNNFSETLMVGIGAYGTVYKGKLRDINGLVAIKRLMGHGSDFEQVINEIKLISSVSHPSLVQLLGCCIDKGEQILVYEFMPNGTLTEHLHREIGQGLSWSSRLSIATEIAKAIAYLHTAIQPPIYHRDIKSCNILLDNDFRPKLADFGLSRTGMFDPAKTHISTAPQGTPGYIDPQYHQCYHLTDKSDVYSFGVVLIEMITAMRVVDFEREANEVNLASLAVDRISKGLLDDIVDPFVKENQENSCKNSVQKVAELAFRCLAFYKDMRPSMTEIAEELEMITNGEFSAVESENFHEQLGESNLSNNSLSSVSDVLVHKMKAFSPVSVQDEWHSEKSSSSSSNYSSNVN